MEEGHLCNDESTLMSLSNVSQSLTLNQSDNTLNQIDNTLNESDNKASRPPLPRDESHKKDSVMSSCGSYCFFASKPVTWYPPNMTKQEMYYDRYFQLFGKKVTNKIARETRRFRCCICGEENSAKETQHLEKHLQSKHPEYLSVEDLVKFKPYLQKVNTLYEAALDKKEKNHIPEAFVDNRPTDNRKKRKMDQHFEQESPEITYDIIHARAIAAGCLPLDFCHNPGFVMMAKHWNKDRVPRNISARTVKRNLDKEKEQFESALKSNIVSMVKEICKLGLKETPLTGDGDEVLKSLPKHVRYFSIQHDGWRNRRKKGFLGTNINMVDCKDEESWKLFSCVLSLEPFLESHSAKNARKLLGQVCDSYNLDIGYMSAGTQDSTSSSYNVFQSDLTVQRLKCVAHLHHLFLKKGLEGDAYFKRLLDAVHEVTVKLCSSDSVTQLLEEEQVKMEKKVLAPLLPVLTRWNEREVTVRRFLTIAPAVYALDPKTLYRTDSADENAKKIETWNDNIKEIKEGTALLEIVLPFMTLVAQWVQVLSSRQCVNISLVLLAHASVRDNITKLIEKCNVLRAGDANSKETARNLYSVCSSLLQAFNEYFGNEFKTNKLYNTACLLDPRTHCVLEDYDIALEYMKEHYCTEQELAQQTPPESGPINAAGRRSAAYAAKKASSDATAATTSRFDPRCAFDKEFDEYTHYINEVMSEEECLSTNPLVFWAKMKGKFRILSRIAACILGIQSCSSEVERLFSFSGQIHSALRGAMKPKTLSLLSTVGHWIKTSNATVKSESSKKRAKVSQESTCRFATLALNEAKNQLVLKAGVLDEEEKDEGELISEIMETVVQETLDKLQRPKFPGPTLPCPNRVPKDLQENTRCALFFEDIGSWVEGVMTGVNKRKVKLDNIDVHFPDGNWSLCATKKNYGIEWVLLDPPKPRVASADPYASDDDAVDDEDVEEDALDELLALFKKVL